VLNILVDDFASMRVCPMLCLLPSKCQEAETCMGSSNQREKTGRRN